MENDQVSGGQAGANVPGILWMLLAMFLFVSMDACVKTLVRDHPTVQIVWARYFFHVVLLVVLLAPRMRQIVKTDRLGLQLVRSLLLLATTALFFTGLRYVPLVESSAMMLISPLLVTALAAVVLKENVGPRRWISVAVGLAGAMIIIRPGSELMQWAILFPTAAACSYAVYQISTRFLSSADPVLTTLFYTAVTGALVSSLAVPFYWVEPTPLAWLLMIGAGLGGGLGHFALIKALTVAPASVVTPFTYSNMIWAAGYGYFLYAELPDLWTVVGAVIIAGSGLYVFYRESQLRAEA
ncbi:MAG: DMT family transporter [Magnetovibrio sp.]|nr:DMT family transporter [Magnetovibrio sp.]